MSREVPAVVVRLEPVQGSRTGRALRALVLGLVLGAVGAFVVALLQPRRAGVYDPRSPR